MLTYHVLVPAYNAGGTLPILLGQLQNLHDKPEGVLIVDDGSTDATTDIAKQYNADVFRFPQNRGKGRALRQGFTMLLENRNADYIICLDADLQHPVSMIPDFIRTAENKKSRFIIGYRSRSIKLMPWPRILSNFITSRILSFLTGQNIKDSQCGFRLISKEVLKETPLQENGFQLESEMLLRLASRRIRIDQIPVPTIYTRGNSHIHHVQDTIKFISLIIKEIGHRVWYSLKNIKQK
jgi:glycosyltransferase involved in cell wall biosynthesis